MYKQILVATDGSPLAGKAVDHGLSLAKSLGASVTFVMVTEIWSPMEISAEVESGHPDAVDEYQDSAERSAKAVLDAAMARAASMDVPAETRHISDCKPSEGILDTAELESCDLIVMASHGRRGLKKMLLGSQTAEVLAESRIPVLVLR